jgi:hypothetical protein
MGLQNNSEGLIGVRSGAGVIDGLTLSLASANAELAVAAGQIKTRFNDAAARQRLNEGGTIVPVAAPANFLASAAALGFHTVFATPAATVLLDTPGTANAIAGAVMLPSLTAMKMSSGNVLLGSVECYLASFTATVGGVPTTGDVLTLTATDSRGIDHSVSVTLTAGQAATTTTAAAALAAAVAGSALADYATAAAAAAVVTLTPTGASQQLAASITGVATLTGASTKKFRNIDYSRRESL